MTFEQYLAKRRYWEFALIMLVVLVGFVSNLGTELIERGRLSDVVDIRQPFVLEATSHVAMALSIPLLLWFDRLWPFRAATWVRSAITHIGFSVIFSFAHVTMMYWARVLTFHIAADGSRYHWDNWLGEFGYEYLKDFRTYFLILALIYLYHFVIRRLQGEAGFLTETRDETAVAPISDRFLVKKLGREFLVRIDEIDWIESCGNYVNLHVGPQSIHCAKR